MERIFILKGLTCPHCSAKIENEVAKIKGVASSSLNLMNQTLTVELSSSYLGDIFEEVTKVVHKHESDVEVIPYNDKEVKPKKTDEKLEKSDKSRLTRLIIGLAVYIAGLILLYAVDISFYLSLAVLIVAYLILGGDVVLKALKNITKGRIFDENFLMSLSTIGAFVIGEYPEAVAVMLFYQIGEFFQDFAVKRSRRSITDLMDIRPESAAVKRDNKIITVSPEEVKIGEIIVVKPGEKVPLDGVVVDGSSMLDTRALTGESLPRDVKVGDSALSGCINLNGVLTIEVTMEYKNSTVSKIIDLVENASTRKAKAENFITTFSRYYNPVVVIFAALLAIVPSLIFGGWEQWIHRGFVFLVISCPCALVISIPLTFFGGIGAASKKGILIKGSNYLEALNSVETVVFDKTGTLTKGVFRVTDVTPENGFLADEVLEFAANAEGMSNHPIAKSVMTAYGGNINEEALSDYKEISGYGICVTAEGRKIAAGNDKLMKICGVDYTKSKNAGTKVYVAVDGKYAGCILISDEIKSDSKKAIDKLRSMGVSKAVMLTGDNREIAEFVSNQLELDEYYAELLPTEKVEKIEELAEKTSGKGKLAFVGDGINDAPVLARADIGIAMGALGSDAAIEAADVVLMTDEPSKLAEAITVAKATKRIVMQNIVFAIGVKLLFLVLGAFGVAGMWEAVFGDVGVMVIAVLNAMRMLKK